MQMFALTGTPNFIIIMIWEIHAHEFYRSKLRDKIKNNNSM